jgi:hypothetical protein
MQRSPAAKREENTFVIRRLRGALTAASMAAAITAYAGTAAYALDECSGVTACVSVPDTMARTTRQQWGSIRSILSERCCAVSVELARHC